MNNTQGQQIFDAIERLRNEIRATRMELALEGKIAPLWPVDNQAKQEVIDIVSQAIDTLSPSEQDQVKNLIENEIKSISTVAEFGGRLLRLQQEINEFILSEILTNIENPGQKISNATNEINIAIDKIQDLNQIFSIITLGVSLVSALVVAGTGNFGLLLSILPKLIQKVAP